MEQVETKVDVLAVMDRAAESAGEIVKASNGDFRAVIYQDDLFKARTAIAELIEASPALTDYLEGYLHWQAVEGNDDVGYEIAKGDIARFFAALARVGGGK